MRNENCFPSKNVFPLLLAGRVQVHPRQALLQTQQVQAEDDKPLLQPQLSGALHSLSCSQTAAQWLQN